MMYQHLAQFTEVWSYELPYIPRWVFKRPNVQWETREFQIFVEIVPKFYLIRGLVSDDMFGLQGSNLSNQLSSRFRVQILADNLYLVYTLVIP